MHTQGTGGGAERAAARLALMVKASPPKVTEPSRQTIRFENRKAAKANAATKRADKIRHRR